VFLCSAFPVLCLMCRRATCRISLYSVFTCPMVIVCVADFRLRCSLVRDEISFVSAVGQSESSESSRPIISKMSRSTLFQMSLFIGH
jgi:hypothetical protein